MNKENSNSRRLNLFMFSFIIGLSLIISTLIYVNYNRYEYFSGEVETIVFDKLTGRKYSPNTLGSNPK